VTGAPIAGVDLSCLQKGKTTMTTVQPEGEDLRKAVKWISEMRQTQPSMGRAQLVEEACLKFNLSPREAEYLAQFVKSK
jgi:uncharacterized membrane protein